MSHGVAQRRVRAAAPVEPDASEALESAQRAVADAEHRLAETDTAISAEEAHVSALQREFAEALERGDDGQRTQTAWATARVSLTALQERRGPLAEAVARRQLEMLRARLELEKIGQEQQIHQAEDLGRVIWEQVENITATIAELRGLIVVNTASRAATIDAAKAVNVPVPAWRTILSASGLSGDVWDALGLLERAAQSARAERQRIAATVTS